MKTYAAITLVAVVDISDFEFETESQTTGFQNVLSGGDHESLKIIDQRIAEKAKVGQYIIKDYRIQSDDIDHG